MSMRMADETAIVTVTVPVAGGAANASKRKAGQPERSMDTL